MSPKDGELIVPHLNVPALPKIAELTPNSQGDYGEHNPRNLTLGVAV